MDVPTDKKDLRPSKLDANQTELLREEDAFTLPTAPQDDREVSGIPPRIYTAREEATIEALTEVKRDVGTMLKANSMSTAQRSDDD